MNIITKLSNTIIAKSLTTLIQFNASKMQASSTQNTQDSAGKRLGYFYHNKSQIKEVWW
jgi:hypothetical protein